MATKLEGGGPLKKELFLRLPLPIMKIMVMAKGGYTVVLTVTSSISIKCKENAFIDKHNIIFHDLDLAKAFVLIQ